MDNEAIVGTCRDMCPEAEIKERERAGLIHVFEKLDGQQIALKVATKQAPPGGRGRGRTLHNRGVKELIKADKSKAVKAYTRPAAGVNKTTPSDLRPPLLLKKTVAYLCTEILTRTDQPFIEVYDFVFDRLRAVRQDMVIQRINDESAIVILEAIVKFHLYAEYRFRHNAPTNYDPCINQKHLRDCLKTLLSFYGYNAYRGISRPYFEALYCICSPESYEVISRAFEIRNEMKSASVFTDALALCLAIQNRNFYRFFQLLDELPPLLATYAVHHVPSIRSYALKAIIVSYGVQTCKIPLEWLQEVLCYPNATRLEKDMIRIGSTIIQSGEGGEKFVRFSKSSPLLNEDSGIAIENDVKLTVLSGLNNIEIVAKEQICPWSHDLI